MFKAGFWDQGLVHIEGVSQHDAVQEHAERATKRTNGLAQPLSSCRLSTRMRVFRRACRLPDLPLGVGRAFRNMCLTMRHPPQQAPPRLNLARGPRPPAPPLGRGALFRQLVSQNGAPAATGAPAAEPHRTDIL